MRSAKELLAALDSLAPASDSLIQCLSEKLGLTLPEDWVEFLRSSNGGEGWVGDNYLRLDSIEEVLAANVDERYWKSGSRVCRLDRCCLTV